MTTQEGRKEVWHQPCISLSSGKQTLPHTPKQDSPSSPGPDPVRRVLRVPLRQIEWGSPHRAGGIWVLGGQPAGAASDEKPRLREVNSRSQGLRGGTSTLSAPPPSGAPVLSARVLWPHFMFARVSWALPLRPSAGRMAGVYGRIPQSHKPVMLALLPVLFTVRH